MTIQQTIDIPASRKVHFDMILPDSLPKGRAQVTLNFTPLADGGGLRSHSERSGESAPYTRRPMDPELTAIVKEAEERTERRRADPVYRAHIEELLGKCQEGPPIFGGIDGMEFQRRARDEWPD